MASCRYGIHTNDIKERLLNRTEILTDRWNGLAVLRISLYPQFSIRNPHRLLPKRGPS